MVSPDPNPEPAEIPRPGIEAIVPEIEKPSPDAERQARKERTELTKHRKELFEAAMNEATLRRRVARVAQIEVQVETIKKENEILEEEICRLWWDRPLRIGATIVIFLIVIAWLGAVLVVLHVQNGQKVDERLSDPVLIALITTTTVNVLGLLYIVARYLFPQQQDMKRRDPSRQLPKKKTAPSPKR